MARNFTREIRKALIPGRNRVVCSAAPYIGREVEYTPRSKGDPKPWRLAGDTQPNAYRFTGRECHVQTFRYVVVEHVNRFYVLDTDGNPPTHFGSVAGVLAVGKAFTSRYAATDAAERLEKDGPLARVDLTREKEAELARSLTVGSTITVEYGESVWDVLRRLKAAR